MKKMVVTMIMAALGMCALNSHAFEGPEGVEIHGFISQGFLISDEYNYLAHNSKDGSFQYNEIGINFSKKLTDKLHLGLQLFSRDIGDAANNKITLDWAYAAYKWRDWLGLRVGRIKLPVGIFNETRDMDMLRTCIVLPQNLYNDLMRDTLIALNGIGIYGYVPLDAAGSLDYEALVGSLNVDNDSGFEKFLNSELAGHGVLNGELDMDTSFAGHICWNTPLSGLALSVSTFLTGEQEIPVRLFNILPIEVENDVRNLIFSVEYAWENLFLACEYRASDIDRKMPGQPTTNTKAEDYYFLASYRLTDWLELGSYYAVSYPDKDDKDGDDKEAMGLQDHAAWQKDLALSVRFDINENWVFKIEGHKVNGTSNVLAIDNPDRSEEDWYYAAAKLTYSF